MNGRTKRVLLVDNGSLEPAGTLQLRRIGAALEARTGVGVEPVSLAHSDRIAAECLDGQSAELFGAGLERVLNEGATEIMVAPLFVGPSHAITRWLPALIEERVKGRDSVSVKVTAPLWIAKEKRLAEMLAEDVRAAVAGGATGARVAVVDHGSPAREVTAARDAVAAQLRELLGDAVANVAACSMERREGAEFDFNEPLLERLLARAEWRRGPLVVALLFVAPGRHAGPGGDVERIVRAARGDDWHNVRFTRVLGEHPRLVEILADRVRDAGEVGGR
ncbi:MAG TPA: CbiX/SirB N-terminal domain-containing protein [Opitutus sp.]|nr:CbiX/SirB N-terminal domain-containing protein [Opitutus sp.]